MTMGQRRSDLAATGWDDEAIDAIAELLVDLTDRARETTAPRISHLQLQALIAIDRHRALNLAGLSGLLTTGMSSTCRLCDRLEAAGLIGRDTRLDNRREVTLSLTPDGQLLLDRIRDQRRAAVAESLVSFAYGWTGLTGLPHRGATPYPQQRPA